MTTENTNNTENTSTENEIDFSNKEAVQAYIAAEIERAKQPVIKKNQEIVGENKKITAHYQELLAKEAAAEEERMKKAGEFDKIKARDDAIWQSKLENESKTAKMYRQQLETHIVDSSAVKAINAADGFAELLLPHVKQFVRAEEVEGKLTTVIVDEAGLPTKMTMDDLIASMASQQKYAPLFKSNKATGGGSTAPNNTNSSVNDNPWSKATFNITKQSILMRDNPTLAAQLKARAQ